MQNAINGENAKWANKHVFPNNVKITEIRQQTS
jgi:hypothetical protein